MDPLPYLTADLPGVGGVIKQNLDDFRVDEIPLYEASGEGTHLYFRVLKAGIPTPAAVGRIARYLGVRPGDIGFAGLKDAHATTSQWMSIEHEDPQKLEAFHDSQMRISDITRHTNKLRPGHLRANRFRVRIRDVGEDALDRAGTILDVLQRRGVPNYFGRQRFGARGDTAYLGRALVRGDSREFVELLLGRPQPDDPPDCKAARDAFDNGYFQRAMKRWPRHYSDQRRALAAYKKKRKAGAAIRAVDKRMRRLFVSALQSAIFNRVLAARIDEIDRVREGDWARKCQTGGVFLVESVEQELPRARAFEISPTGPLPGSRCRLAQGEAGDIERRAIAEEGMSEEDFDRVGSLRVKGTRRPLRFAVEDASVEQAEDQDGRYLELTFNAPSGCYATVLLREITKSDPAGASP